MLLREIISDKEYFILSDYASQRTYPLFALESMLIDECKTEFLFEKTHLPLLADKLQSPPMFKCSQGSVANGMEALCMLLKGLSYPCLYADMVHTFARPIAVLSMVTSQVLDSIHDITIFLTKDHWKNIPMLYLHLLWLC